MSDAPKPEKPEKRPLRRVDPENALWTWKTREGRLRVIGLVVAALSTLAILYLGMDWWEGRQQQEAIKAIPQAKVARATWSGKILALSMDGVGDAELHQLADLSLPDLQALQLEECTFSEQAIQRLGDFENLYALDLSGTPLEETAADTIVKLNNLRKLDLTRCGLALSVIQRIQERSNGMRVIR